MKIKVERLYQVGNYRNTTLVAEMDIADEMLLNGRLGKYYALLYAQLDLAFAKYVGDSITRRFVPLEDLKFSQEQLVQLLDAGQKEFEELTKEFLSSGEFSG